MREYFARFIADLADRADGHIRVDTGPLTDRERRRLAVGSAGFLTALIVYFLTVSLPAAVVAQVAVMLVGVGVDRSQNR